MMDAEMMDAEMMDADTAYPESTGSDMEAADVVGRRFSPAPHRSGAPSPAPASPASASPTPPRQGSLFSSLDEYVGPCSLATPSLQRYYDCAAAAVCNHHSVRTGSCHPHVITSVAATGPAFSPLVSFVILGRDDDYAYTGHYLLDLRAPSGLLRIAAMWSQCAWMHYGELDPSTFVPLAHVLLEVFGRSLDIGVRLGVGEQHSTGRAPPMMRMGCYTDPAALESVVADSRRRRGAAVAIQRATRRVLGWSYERRRDARRRARGLGCDISGALERLRLAT